MKFDEISIVCISLDRRPDRWTHMSAQASAAGIHMERLAAVDAKNFVAHKHPAVSLGTAHNIYYGVRRSHYEIDAAGAVGASLSHYKAWEKLLASSAPAMIVFEDDIVLPADFKTKLEAVLPTMPPDCDIMQLQRTNFGNGAYGCKPIPGQEPWELCTSLMGAFAYMITREGARKMLERAYPIELHVDAYMAYMARMDHIKMIWHPSIDIDPSNHGSDIEHGSCAICMVPTNMKKHGVVALEVSSVIGIMTMAAITGGILALAFVRPSR